MFDINKIKKLLKKWVLKLILQMQRQKRYLKTIVSVRTGK